MKNLAGDKDADRDIQYELKAAKIEIVKGNLTESEVPYTLTGKLGPFTFRRAWYYWVAEGPMPLDMANKLYEELGHDIRVAGHCGCPPPEKPWITWRDDQGNELIPLKEKEEIDRFIAKGHILPEQMKGRRFVERPEEGHGFIESYHIDTQAGLMLFADAARIVTWKRKEILAL